MSTILLLLMFPIGALFYWNEQKNKGKYQAVFDNYMDKVDADAQLTDMQKITQVRKLFLANRYEVTFQNEKEIIAERKVLSMGLLLMGLFFYVFYFFFFQKAHSISYHIKS
jgi:hypothetical protein